MKRRGFVLVFVLVLGSLLITFLLVASPGSELATLLAQREWVAEARSQAESSQQSLLALYSTDPLKAAQDPQFGPNSGQGMNITTPLGSSSAMALRSSVQPYRQLMLEDFPQDHARQQWRFVGDGCGGVVQDQRLYMGDIGPLFGLSYVTPRGNPAPSKLPAAVWSDYDIAFNVAYYGMSGFGVAFHLNDRCDGDCLLFQPRVAASGPQLGNIIGANLQLCPLQDRGTNLVRPMEGMQPLDGFPFTSDHIVRPQTGNAASYSVSWDIKLSIEGRKLTMFAKNDNGDYDPFGNPIQLTRLGSGALGFYTEPGTIIGISNLVVDNRGPAMLQECSQWER